MSPAEKDTLNILPTSAVKGNAVKHPTHEGRTASEQLCSHAMAVCSDRAPDSSHVIIIKSQSVVKFSSVSSQCETTSNTEVMTPVESRKIKFNASIFHVHLISPAALTSRSVCVY